MAPVGENVEINGFSSKKKDETDNKESLWSAILGEVQTRGNTKLPSCKSVLVLGDNESGKTTLIAKLQGVEDPKKGSGLEFAYIDLRDEYRDDHTRLSVWVLDGDPSHAQLLRFALSEESFPHTLVMFVVAMTTPWGVLDQLQTWATVLQDHIDKLKLSADDLQEAKHKYIKKWQDYVEPGDELEQGSPMRRTSRNLDEEDTEILPLGEGILTRNLGLDVVVVVTKTDYMTTLEKDYDYRAEHFDFIQQWIRRFCLQYGAALFYTSAKEDKNCDLLYKYLMHRIYGFPFRTPALVVEKDAVLIPSGWDNMKKISILYENMQSMKPDDYYRDVIVQPVIRKPVTRESEMQAEDEQSFLMRQLQLLQQGAPALRQESPLRTPAGVQKSADRRATGSRGVQGQLGLPKKIDGSKAGVTGSGEGVLENFFNSLPYKKTRAGTTTQKMPGKTMLRVAEVRSWHVIFPNGLKKNVVTFVNTLCHTGRTMGMNFPDPVYKPVHFNQLRSYFEAINSCVIEENPSILLVILPNKSPHRYGVIKKRCLGEWSVPTQLILNRTLTLKNLPTIATKVVIQMNCKLGGAPWTVNIPSKSLMVIGFDVYHKASKENPSIGVMVASQDPEMSRYFTQVNHYHNEEELSNVLSSSVCKAARRFAQLNGSLPRKVIVYRDGVGEGQIPSVHQHEVQKLESQLKKLYGDVKCEMAFVIVTKRINTLFFHHRDNPPPGTVVDDVVTLPDRYDFFLVSQSVCVGTASPVSYNVIHDATPLTADQIQRLTYKLTHLYYNWNGTVRVPAPVLYAHKLAYLVGQVTHSLPSQQMAQLLYFL